MTKSIQLLDQRTQKDLQYVVRMEDQLKGLETKFRQVEETHKQNLAKQYKVCHTSHTIKETKCPNALELHIPANVPTEATLGKTQAAQHI